MRINRLIDERARPSPRKLEFYNPASSVKDRIGVAIIDAAEASGELKPGGTIVEATSRQHRHRARHGRRGPRLQRRADDARDDVARSAARCCAPTAPSSSSPRAPLGMKGAVAKAEEIAAERGGDPGPQFANEANPEIHRKTTAEEIWKDTDGQVDIVVAGIGTGGTITGVGQVLKARKPGVQIIAVEPEPSRRSSTAAQPGPHKIQGIGANFVPEILDRDDLRRGHRRQRRDLGRVGPPRRHGGGPARRHLLRCRARRRRPGRQAPRERRQDDRRHHPVVR